MIYQWKRKSFSSETVAIGHPLHNINNLFKCFAFEPLKRAFQSCLLILCLLFQILWCGPILGLHASLRLVEKNRHQHHKKRIKTVLIILSLQCFGFENKTKKKLEIPLTYSLMRVFSSPMWWTSNQPISCLIMDRKNN